MEVRTNHEIEEAVAAKVSPAFFVAMFFTLSLLVGVLRVVYDIPNSLPFVYVGMAGLLACLFAVVRAAQRPGLFVAGHVVFIVLSGAIVGMNIAIHMDRYIAAIGLFAIYIALSSLAPRICGHA